MLLKSIKKALCQPTKLSVLVFLLSISFASCTASHLSHLKKKSQNHVRRRRSSSKASKSLSPRTQPNNEKGPFALIVGICLAGGAGLVYWCFYKKEDKQANVLRIGTANAGGEVASNAFEFLEYKNLYPQSLQADYEKIHQVTEEAFNMPWKEFVKKYISSSGNEEGVLVTEFNFDEDTFTGVINQMQSKQNEQSEEKKEDNKVTMLDILKAEPYSMLSRIDKEFREHHLITYNMLEDSNHLKIDAKKSTPLATDLQAYDEIMKGGIFKLGKFIEGHNKKCNDDKNYSQADKAKKYYEIAFIRVLREEGLLEKAKEIQKEFYNGPLGNNEEKAKKFVAIIKPQKLDIILFQEASQAIFDELEKEGYQYFFPKGANGKQDVGIAYDPDIVELKEEFTTGNEKITTETNKNSERIAAAHFTHTKTAQSFFAVSVHSDSKGKDAEKRLEQISDFLQLYRLSNQAFIISHDANTTDSKEDIRKGEKGNADYYWQTLFEYCWKSVFDLQDYQNAYGAQVTSSKTRGYATQTQFSKGGPKKNRGDFFATRNIDEENIIKKEVIEPGFSQENNTDHVIHIVDWKIKNQSEK